jgi:2-C-methyl-D-erythritol 4-phosphate cytidylyltransferase
LPIAKLPIEQKKKIGNWQLNLAIGNTEMPQFAVILPAAGTSARFAAEKDKLLEPLGGTPVIVHSLNAFLQRRDVVEVVIPTRRPDLLADQIPRDERVKMAPGGASRAESVRSGLSRIPESIEWVAVHDAARPLVSQPLIDATLAAAIERGAAVPALPVGLTIKEASGPLPARVERTVPRQSLWAMQTPQIMRRGDLIEAFDRCPIALSLVTDDVQLLELVDKPVWLVPGEERNLKITTPIDLRVAELLMEEVADEQVKR